VRDMTRQSIQPFLQESPAFVEKRDLLLALLLIMLKIDVFFESIVNCTIDSLFMRDCHEKCLSERPMVPEQSSLQNSDLKSVVVDRSTNRL
jgi:hypothetical protein